MTDLPKPFKSPGRPRFSKPGQSGRWPRDLPSHIAIWAKPFQSPGARFGAGRRQDSEAFPKPKTPKAFPKPAPAKPFQSASLQRPLAPFSGFGHGAFRAGIGPRPYSGSRPSIHIPPFISKANPPLQSLAEIHSPGVGDFYRLKRRIATCIMGCSGKEWAARAGGSSPNLPAWRGLEFPPLKLGGITGGVSRGVFAIPRRGGSNFLRRN